MKLYLNPVLSSCRNNGIPPLQVLPRVFFESLHIWMNVTIPLCVLDGVDNSIFGLYDTT